MDGISLGQGKYALDILKRFRMMDCKDMTTPMASNMNLLSDASSETVDATMYFQLMYLTNTIRYFLCCEHIETCSLDCYNAYFGVLEGYN